MANAKHSAEFGPGHFEVVLDLDSMLVSPFMIVCGTPCRLLRAQGRFQIELGAWFPESVDFR
jgi:hypothetical protein